MCNPHEIYKVGHRYSRRIDPDSQDSLARIASKIKRSGSVLELGVATGYFSRFLRKKLDCVVDGVEIDPAMAEEAKPWCRKLLVGDLEEVCLSEHFPKRSYDHVVCADVLEHLRDPAYVLEQLPDLLNGTGNVLISIPNIAYAGLIFELISGGFSYRDEGLLDRTHLRFFTKTSFLDLLQALSYTIVEVDRVHLPFEMSEFASIVEQADPMLRDRLAALPDSDVYQYIITAEAGNAIRMKGDAPEPSPSGPDKLSLNPGKGDGGMGVVVDIIVPVYGGLYETRQCLDSVLSNPQRTPFELVVIDDASPERDLKTYLEHIAKAGSITLLRNKNNIGFAGTVNRGMALHPDRDIVLLNSDTEVANDWLDRIRGCALSDPEIGTVTPFSNNATICSYPVFCQENSLPQGWDVRSLDRLFSDTNSGAVIDIPTAVGFCMYIKRPCLVQLGLFDEKSFGLGYGEENDFCMKAAKAGWRHVLCGDTFVYHAGGVSFSESKERLQKQGNETLVKLHPDYLDRIRKHLAEDPARHLRLAVDSARKRVSTSRGQTFVKKACTKLLEKVCYPKIFFMLAGLGFAWAAKIIIKRKI
jgi:GT2 family glycosyltransferase/SAM-dependent methyltransferase